MAVGQITGVAESESEPLLKTLVRRYGYGTILIGTGLVLWWAVENRETYPLEWIAVGVQIFSIVTITSLEFWVPYIKRWGTLKQTTRADVIYFLLAAPIDQLATFLLIGVLATTKQYHSYIAFFDIWPSNAHVLIQLFLVIMIVDFFKYWYHRWTHEVPILWRIHSIHHSLDRLEMLRASYFFPLDIFLTVATGTFALLMFGVGYEIIVFHNVWAGITGLLNHSNTDLNTKAFDGFLNSPPHHRAHHSVGRPGCFSNYGSFFNWTDRMFGTRYCPQSREEIGELGLEEGYRMPTTFLKQLAVPFVWNRIKPENQRPL